ncbi:putative aspartic endopeptidase NDAI_0C04610 [Naumovozyma dairenensis CBS 421]|uniref:Peptidase A1 domain-containing protein n=1 Tax=Naumovozyma dairenensis (strain ATCC 10597 / BCRC 20456 / CBS 421 / NBRC 0211 / NRRL Y-12639) TaxID=1071378 RepID=G0W8L0_NAUDC|nr:hypothetical protein NDAI_0C04610 [Naumovozyma dairenensis CBS 421]CCD24121.1 hypothetical protein NDAI_0C04610 [Naumovozyma dairenensis CBS 421]
MYLISYLILISSLIFRRTLCATTATSSIEKPFPTINIGTTGSGIYYINITMGTPEQQQELMIDTSQPYTWLLSGSQDLQCNRLNSGCLSGSLYYVKESTSAICINPNRTYHMAFIDQSEINGTHVIDMMNFTNVDVNTAYAHSTYNTKNNKGLINLGTNYLGVSNVSFINADDTVPYAMGSLGLSGKITGTGTDIDSSNFDNSYDFLDRLYQTNLIDSHSYSLWLAMNQTYNGTRVQNSVTSSFGKLILGAVDPTLFTGSFLQFEMLPALESDSATETIGYPIIPMGPIYVVSKSGEMANVTSKDFLEPVFLDSTYTSTYLPLNMIIQVAIQIGAMYVESLERWLVPCNIANQHATLDFTFQDVSIRVPLTDLLGTTYDSSTNTSMHFSTGDEACYLKIFSNQMTGYNILGRPFLKHVYMAVDLDGNNIAIAQATQEEELQAKENVLDEEEDFTFASGLVKRANSNNNTINASITTIATRRSSSSSGVLAISSGYIPYATSLNMSKVYTRLFASTVSSKRVAIPGPYTASVYSNGIVVGPGRSFYVTSTSSATTRSSTTHFDSFVVTAMDNSTDAQYTMSAMGSPSGLQRCTLTMLVVLVSGFFLNLFL